MNDFEDIVVVCDDDGNEQEFEILDRIETDDNKKYVAMTPFTENDESDEADELIILRVIETEEENILEPIEDENEFNEIASIFEERLAEFFDFDEE